MKILFLENQVYNSDITVGSHHYARLFSNDGHDVFWVSLPWHVPQFLKNPKIDRVRQWRFGKPRISKEGIISISPFVLLPYRDNVFLRSKWYLRRYVNFQFGVLRILKVSGFKKVDLVWVTDPRHFSLLKYINYQKCAYRCVDNLEHFKDVPGSLLGIENELVKRVDALFYTSPLLGRKFGYLTSKSVYLPNGAEYSRFSNFSNKSNLRHLFKTNKFNIIYMGAVAEWFDFDLIETLSTEINLNIIIVGPLRVSPPARLSQRTNVTFTGGIPYDLMPELVKRADLGIIPFIRNTMTDYVSPIKLFEYCSGGLNVVTSFLKTLESHPGPYYVAKTQEQFVQHVHNLRKDENSRFSKEELLQFGKENSWSRRYIKVLDYLQLNG